MKVPVLSSESFLLLSLFGFAIAQQMPEAVARFEETRDLWEYLHAGALPGKYYEPLRGPPSESWLQFVREKGDELFKEG